MTWLRPRGTLSGDGLEVSLAPEAAGWDYSGLTVASLGEGEVRTFRFERDEVVVLPLTGSFRLDSGVLTVELEGRSTLFGELAGRAYLPPGIEFTLTALHPGDVAVCTARADAGGEPAYRAAADTSVEVRGAGQATRQINGIWPADVEGPERIIVVEVLTPEGNWSSYPPHKHDEWGEGEVPLEEIYYFRIDGAGGFGLHRTYTKDRDVDETVGVGNGDVFLIPRGFHGPCVAAPGYHMYYLNVMGGPERSWEICTDPAHEWLWEEWADVAPDPRLPMVR